MNAKGLDLRVLSPQTIRFGLRPAAAPVFGQQPSIYQENTRGDAAAEPPIYGTDEVIRREFDALARLH